MASPRAYSAWSHNDLSEETRREFERVGKFLAEDEKAINALAGALGLSPGELGDIGDKDPGQIALWALTVFHNNSPELDIKVVQGLNFQDIKRHIPTRKTARLPIKWNINNTTLEEKYRTIDDADKTNIEGIAELDLDAILQFLIKGRMSVQNIRGTIDDSISLYLEDIALPPVWFNLVNDEETPGGNKYYGTNGAGTKGFHALPTGSGSANCGKLEVDFDYTDLSLGASKLIGNIPANTRIFKAVIIVATEFDNDAQITLGDGGGAGRIAIATDSDLEVDTSYDIELEVEYTIATDLYLYQANGVPTTGNGTVIIYYSGV